ISLGRDDFLRAAVDESSAAIDAAITELLSQRVLAGDARAYVLTRREWATILLSALDAAGLSERHRMRARVYAEDDSFIRERVHHMLAGGVEQAALDLLV